MRRRKSSLGARGGLLAGTADKQALQAVADALITLGQQKSLFPAAHFPIDAVRPAQVYRLAEDADGGFVSARSVI